MYEKDRNPENGIESLWLSYHILKKPEIREQLIEHYLFLVKMVAGKIAVGLPQHVDREDLISNGFLGLMDAVERYDPTRNVKFETYAVTRIRGAILDSIRAQDWLPVTVRQKAKQYEKTVAKLENNLGRSVTDQEVANAMDMSLEQLHILITQLNASIVAPLDEISQGEKMGSVYAGMFESIEDEEVKITLAEAIDKLPEKERTVVSLYYYEDLTLKEISLILQLSEARISQLHTKAVFRLRGALTKLQSSLL